MVSTCLMPEVEVNLEAPPVCLWQENPYRLVSLWDMISPIGMLCWTCCELLKTSTIAFAGIADDFGRGRRGPDFDRWREDRYEYTTGMLSNLTALFQIFDMPVTKDKLRTLSTELASKGAPGNKFDAGWLTQELMSLVRIVGTELSAVKFLYVPQAKHAHSFSNPLPPLAALISGHFDSAIDDALEASHCFAFGRNTACVFHCMRVLEVALHAISRATGVSDPRPNWDPVIKRLDKLLKMDSDHLKKNPQDRVPEIHDHADFYAGCSSHFHAIKIAWRNRTMHVDRTYSDQNALEIMNATTALVTHLSSRLSQSVT